ncbi:SbtR family transcriptional regulator [Bradyrhizobium sp. AZCC 2289]|uniref:SbtR family transcriptional regulator n=1 Tax=Bradyrhizobium sp. AZCC 2289 TaxID=3117026 RepID=UPI002FF3B1AD
MAGRDPEIRAWRLTRANRCFASCAAPPTGHATPPARSCRPADAVLEYSSRLYTDAVTLLVQRATESGDIREGVDPVDLLGALGALAHGSARADWQARALRLLDILMDGLRCKQPIRLPTPE